MMTMNENSKLGYREGIVSVVLNLFLFVLKYYAGVVSASVALVADAPLPPYFSSTGQYEKHNAPMPLSTQWIAMLLHMPTCHTGQTRDYPGSC